MSSDFVHDPNSSIFDAGAGIQLSDNFVKIVSWCAPPRPLSFLAPLDTFLCYVMSPQSMARACRARQVHWLCLRHAAMLVAGELALVHASCDQHIVTCVQV